MKMSIFSVPRRYFSSKLFTNYQFKNSKSIDIKNNILEVSNRIVIAPMCQYSSENGEANDWHLMHWGNLLNSGCGMFIIEATGVSPEARISDRCLGLWNQATQDAIHDKLTRARNLAPTVPVLIQLAHAGRKSSTTAPWINGGGILPIEKGGWKTYSASPIPFYDNITSPNCVPIEMSHEDMKKVRTDFVNAAKRSKVIGIDGVEIHSAHGYLLHQFLSPLSNKRTDKYGGSLENRLRFPLEIFDAVRQVSDGVVGVRLSATDWVEGGWNADDSLVYSKELVSRGCSYIHVSTGGLSSLQKIPVGPSYQVPFAETIKKTLPNTAVIAVGLITDPHQAETILQEGKADFIALARAVLFKPRWGWEAAVALGGSVDASEQYWRCLPAGSPRHTFRYPTI